MASVELKGLSKRFGDAVAVDAVSLMVEHGRLVLHLAGAFSTLAGERVFVRLRQLARLIGREPVVETDDRPRTTEDR